MSIFHVMGFQSPREWRAAGSPMPKDKPKAGPPPEALENPLIREALEKPSNEPDDPVGLSILNQAGAHSASDAAQFEAMAPMARAELKGRDRARYHEMRNAWLEANGEAEDAVRVVRVPIASDNPYGKLSNFSRAELRKRDPKLFAALRAHHEREREREVERLRQELGQARSHDEYKATLAKLHALSGAA
jgi:hypothetical protein